MDPKHNQTIPGWKHSRVGDLCAVLNGLAFKPEEWKRSGLPIIRIQNLNGSDEFNFYDRPVPQEYIIPPGTLLFSWSGNRGTSFGPYVWNRSSGILNQHIFRVLPRADVNQDWLYYALDGVRKQAERAAHGGSGLVHVRRGDLLAYEVPTPPLHEQRCLANVLDTLDEAVLKTEQLIAKMKQMKQGLLHDLLTRGIDESGKLRQHESQFKNSSLGRIPAQWRVGGLLDIGAADRQPILTGPFGVQLSAADFVETGVPVLRIGNVQWGHLDLTDLVCVSHEKADVLAKFRIRTGDLLFARQGATTGRNALADASVNGWLINYHIIRVAVDRRRCHPTFLYAVFNSPIVQEQVDREKGRSTREGVNTKTLTSFLLPLPEIQEQERIAEILEAYDARIFREESSLAKLRLLKQGLMDDLLTGRVRVTPLLAEPSP